MKIFPGIIPSNAFLDFTPFAFNSIGTFDLNMGSYKINKGLSSPVKDWEYKSWALTLFYPKNPILNLDLSASVVIFYFIYHCLVDFNNSGQNDC